MKFSTNVNIKSIVQIPSTSNQNYECGPCLSEGTADVLIQITVRLFCDFTPVIQVYRDQQIEVINISVRIFAIL